MTAVPQKKLFSVALALAAALSTIGAGCRSGKPLATPPAAVTRSAPQLVAEPTPDQPGRIALEFREGDFQAPDLVVPPGNYEIVVKNLDNSLPTGFFLRLPDQYGRETHHVPGGTGAGIRRGGARVFSVELRPGQAYLYNCPVTNSPDHLLTAAAGSPASGGGS